ncbi:hypothetical protein [Pseudomonas chlororaphis]|uniref:hypothetical protein n=1 Tax=Pseudomonas chlororaphis TaxID=587753 RepID=UPI0006A63E26|nr:hypothetical protein [Pseudomonas chlororaphis]
MSILIGVASIVVVGATAFYLIPMIARGRQGYNEDREKAQEALEKKQREEAAGREKNRRHVHQGETVEFLDMILANPERYCATTSFRGGWKYPHVKSLVDQFRHWEQVGRTNRSQEKQISELSRTIRELRAEVKEVHRKLEPYA